MEQLSYTTLSKQYFAAKDESKVQTVLSLIDHILEQQFVTVREKCAYVQSAIFIYNVNISEKKGLYRNKHMQLVKY